MWFREERDALETPSNCEYSCEDVGTLKRTVRKLPDLSKTANFSISTEGEKWPPFPRLKGRGPIEAISSGLLSWITSTFPRLKGRGPIEAIF